MSNALVIRNDMDVMKLGEVLARSGFFTDSRDAAQAVVKVLAGQELGFGPLASMTGVNIIKGRVTLSANLLAAAVKRSGKYSYRVTEHTDKVCEIEFTENGQVIGTSRFTMEDAKLAQLGGDNWRKFPANMLFARAISNGAKWHCPDIFGGPVYTPDELGAEVDEDGGIVEAAPRIVDQHGEVTRDDPAPIVPPVKTDADRAADRAARRLNPAPAGNGRADVSTHNPPVESMAAEMPQQALDATRWTHEPGRINKMVAWARETVWKGIELSHARNRVAKALGVSNFAAIAAEYRGTAEQAMAAIQAYVPSDQREDAPAEQPPLEAPTTDKAEPLGQPCADCGEDTIRRAADGTYRCQACADKRARLERAS